VTPDLRGADWNKYRGSSVYQAEVEYRHKFSTLWSGVAFAGAAVVRNEDRQFANSVKSEVIPSAGIGVRYLLNAKERFTVGVDAAVSKMGNTSFYIRFGEAF
jgi:outer membrane translocation and assembly module TamA